MARLAGSSGGRILYVLRAMSHQRHFRRGGSDGSSNPYDIVQVRRSFRVFIFCPPYPRKFSSDVPVKREEQTGVGMSAVESVKISRDGNDDAPRHL